MKKVSLLAAALILSASLFAQKKATDVIRFKDLSHDFGKIQQGTPVTYNFEFSNISDGPIVIESALASCGCTTPAKPEAPVPKGKDDMIVAGFNAAAPGPFNKTIDVKIAGVQLPVTLRITGFVVEKQSSAPTGGDKSGGK